MIIVRARQQQVAFPKHSTWAIFTRNEHYVDENGDLVPDISSGFGPYMDVCIFAKELFVFPNVYAGYQVADSLQRYINAHFLSKPIIIADLEELCKDTMGFRQYGEFAVVCNGKSIT